MKKIYNLLKLCSKFIEEISCIKMSNKHKFKCTEVNKEFELFHAHNKIFKILVYKIVKILILLWMRKIYVIRFKDCYVLN